MIDDRKCYATIRMRDDDARGPRTFLALNDDLEPFETDESVVVIAESEYEAMQKRIERLSYRVEKLEYCMREGIDEDEY